MQLAPPTQPVTGKVVENVPCLNGKSSSFIRHISIDVTGTPLEGNFRAGQAFGIVPPGIDARGRSEKVRLYSISSPSRGEDGEGKVLSTTCKRALEELDHEARARQAARPVQRTCVAARTRPSVPSTPHHLSALLSK